MPTNMMLYDVMIHEQIERVSPYLDIFGLFWQVLPENLPPVTDAYSISGGSLINGAAYPISTCWVLNDLS